MMFCSLKVKKPNKCSKEGELGVNTNKRTIIQYYGAHVTCKAKIEVLCLSIFEVMHVFNN